MVSAETLLNDPDCKIPFTFPTGAYDKQLGAVISQKKILLPYYLHMEVPHGAT